MGHQAWQIEQEGDSLVATPSASLGEIDLERFREGARTIVALLERGTARNIVVDLKNTSYFGSSAVGLFIAFWRTAKKNHGRIALCSLSEHELEILQVTNLHREWPICKDRKAALKAVGV